MAEFVGDGHKYGVKWDIPWGLAPKLIEQTTGQELLYLAMVFTANVNGEIKTLWPSFYGNLANEATVNYSFATNAAPYEFYVIFDVADPPLSYKTGQYLSEFVKNIWSQPLSETQFLARVTVHSVKTSMSVSNLYCLSAHFIEGYTRTGLIVSYSAKNNAGYPAPAGFYVEFSAESSPLITDLSFWLGSKGSSAQADPKYGIITKENKVFCYWDDYEVEALGAGGISRFDENLGSNLISFAKPQPLNCVYRNNGGGVYVIDTSSLVPRSYLEELEARIAVLEGNTDG